MPRFTRLKARLIAKELSGRLSFLTLRHPDIDYYLGRRDRMLETAIEVLKKKIAMKQ
ncbi:MAG: hypothetical protein ABGX22_06080 [Pirellulaceae bacterium]